MLNCDCDHLAQSMTFWPTVMAWGTVWKLGPIWHYSLHYTGPIAYMYAPLNKNTASDNWSDHQVHSYSQNGKRKVTPKTSHTKIHLHHTKLEQTVASSLYFPIPVIKAVLSAKFVSKEISYTTDAGSGSIIGCSSGSASASRHWTLFRASCNVAIFRSNVRRDCESMRKSVLVLIKDHHCENLRRNEKETRKVQTVNTASKFQISRFAFIITLRSLYHTTALWVCKCH